MKKQNKTEGLPERSGKVQRTTAPARSVWKTSNSFCVGTGDANKQLSLKTMVNICLLNVNENPDDDNNAVLV